MPTTVKDAYIAKGTAANILVVDWREYSGWLLSHFTTCLDVDKIGDVVGEYLHFLKGNGLLPSAGDLEAVRLVRHSLSAHLSANAGDYIKRQKGRLGRITGLDAAGPGYHTSTHRLDSGDAKFVDVMHTNAGEFKLFHGLDLGLTLRSGDPSHCTRFEHSRQSVSIRLRSCGLLLKRRRAAAGLRYQVYRRAYW